MVRLSELDEKLRTYKDNKRRLPFAAAYYDSLDYDELRLELEKLEAAVEALPDMEQKIIKALYYDGLTWLQIQMKLYISMNTINRTRKKALLHLLNIYNPQESQITSA